MDKHSADDLQRRVQRVLLEWFEENHGPFSATSSYAVGTTLEAAKHVVNLADLELRRWVELARDAGFTWSEVGEHIGTTKQWAAKRFAPVREVDSAGGSADGAEVIGM